jgi:NADH:ubiquinone oxidoreductase subunit 6 (subunit J)
VTAETVGFWAVALVLVASSLGAVLAPNLFHAVLFLAVALVATGGIFLLLDAAFLFGVQLLLYAGGVVTVLVFAIMLTERIVGQRLSQTNRYVVNGALVSAAVFVAIAGFLVRRPGEVAPTPSPGDATVAIGTALVGRFAGPFELLAVLLVAALLGALYLARTED